MNILHYDVRLLMYNVFGDDEVSCVKLLKYDF